MIQESFPAMGTTVTAVVEDGTGTQRCRSLFAAVEARLSRFLPDSHLSLLNRDPAPVVDVPPTLAAVLTAAQSLMERTDGLVDPAVGSAVTAWGYDRTFSEVEQGRPSPSPLRRGSWQIEGTTLRRTPGTRFDLGGIAKGWTADLAVERGLALMVSAGGDIRSATDDAVVEILDPEGTIAARVRLGRGALATSSVAKRRWRTSDGEANHIIDPRTMEPTRSPIVAASAACATAAESEAAAKAILLLGADGLRWAAERSWIEAALVVWHDASVFATRGWEMAA
ncbi:MAG: hypothetical protein EHM57_04205 [Actinobacteria bacterium]|nr:MAG: hypothetical protein EHM57_04205 [Actinomycetota bacterium]